MAEFLVTRIFTLENRKTVFICGTILSGEIRKGMIVKILVDSELFWVKPVDTVEYVHSPMGKSETALGLLYSDSEELHWITGLSPIGESIKVVEENESKIKNDT